MKVIKVLMGSFFSLLILSALGSEYKTCVSDYGVRYIHLPGLKKGSLYIKESNGPVWGNRSHTYLIDEAIDDIDIPEMVSYWNEDGSYDASYCPHFTEKEFEEAIAWGHWYSWQAIKRTQGPKKTRFYLGTVWVDLHVLLKNGKTKRCSLEVNGGFLFLNKKPKSVDSAPTYLGRFVDSFDYLHCSLR